MLYTIYSMLKTGAFLFLLNDYLKRNYPKSYDKTLIIISFNAIYMYSICELEYKKAKKHSKHCKCKKCM